MTMPADLAPSGEPTVDPATEVTPPIQPSSEPVAQAKPQGQTRMVPLSEVTRMRRAVGEMREFVKGEIGRIEGMLRPPSTPPGVQLDPNDPQAQYLAQLQQRLGLTDMRGRLDKFEKLAEKFNDVVERFPNLQHTSDLAMNNYHRQIEGYAAAQHDPKWPIPKDAWLNMVAGGMTEDVVHDLMQGDSASYMELVENCKSYFKVATPQAPPQLKPGEMRKLGNLPKLPGSGGIPPGPPEETRAKGAALHSRAYSRLQDSFKRGRGGGTPA